MAKIIDFHSHKGDFFKVLQTTDKTQIGVMTISSGEKSGERGIHGADQFVYVIEGSATARIGDESVRIDKGQGIVIPAGKEHEIISSGKEDLFFLTTYSPAEY